MEFDSITKEIKKTVVFCVFGFMTTSAFRVWQIKTLNKNISLGVSVILASYMPAYLFYSYHRYNQQ